MRKEKLMIYQSSNNEKIEVLRYQEDFWLTQKSMAKLFHVAENNITYHLQNIFKTKELEEIRTTQKIRVVQKEGNRNVSREVTFYNLDAIIAVGYRVNSKEATDFRIWVSKFVKESNRKIKNRARNEVFISIVILFFAFAIFLIDIL